ncbi:oligosaccharide flippase family protein [Microbacterium sp. KUDC0406]|uniref:lipopolysaccharide biosynthesis protein n=1 Tax=Microbacterium sp. KUDC0406 TaxID=2909588 RepID=UPI001F3343BA|nr:oligosaccharide flippase family protein [Microbacterium sp. KUDC0406]UJP08912.1 oligosaccharide flippase family protein [Microbacterium sp. KUDC0406]
MFRGAVSKILLGTLIGQGAVLLVSPVLSRLYTPADFGAFAMVTAVCAVLSSLATFSWERAVVLPREDAEARVLIKLGLVTMVVVISVVTVVMYFGRNILAEISGVVILESFWWVIPVSLVAMSLNALVSAWIVRRQDYSGLAVRNAAQGIAQAAWSVGLGWIGLAPFGLVSSLAAGRFAGLFGLGLRSRRSDPPPDSRVEAVSMREVARRYRRFPLINTWSSMVNSIGLQLPSLLLIAVYGAAEAGLFALTMRVLAAPVGMIVDAVSKHFESTFAHRLRERQPGLRQMVLILVSRQTLLGVGPALIVMICGPWLFSMVFGSQWAGSGVFAQLVVVAYLAQFIVVPVSRGLVLLEQQAQQLWWDVSRAVGAACAIMGAGLVDLDMGWALAGWATVQVLSYAIMLLLVLRAATARDQRNVGRGGGR